MKHAFIRILAGLAALLLCPLAALGDGDTYRTPGTGQLTEQQALEIAIGFFEELCGVSIEESIRAGEYTALFGPGDQWHAETTADCWAVTLPLGSDCAIHPCITLDGVTGEALWWSFRDKATGISYIGMLPEETMLSLDQAAGIACNSYAAAHRRAPGELGEPNISASFGRGEFMLYENAEAARGLPVWSIFISAPDAGLTGMREYLINALDGSIMCCIP